jgi:hypothetical protein
LGRIGKLLLLLLLLPLAIIFVTPVFCVAVLLEKILRNRMNSNKCEKLNKIFLAILAFLLGLALNIITIPIIIVFGIPIYVSVKIYEIFKRRKEAK